jgi:hypothetical protein
MGLYSRFKQEWQHFDCTAEKCVDPACNLHEIITPGKGDDVVQQTLNETDQQHVPAHL